MSRPIGQRIRQVMAIVDQMGHATANQVLAQMKGVCKHNVGKYCSRAVGLGLLSADRSGYQIVYSTQYDWREKIAARDPKRGEMDGATTVQRAIKTQPNSVFALGNM